MAETIRVASSGEILARRARWARSRTARMRGLLGRARPGPGEALIIDGAPQVHTFGLGYPIDVVFCDSDWTVRHVVRSMRPRRVSRWVRKARFAIELPARSVGGHVAPGEKLSVDHVDGTAS